SEGRGVCALVSLMVSPLEIHDPRAEREQHERCWIDDPTRTHVVVELRTAKQGAKYQREHDAGHDAKHPGREECAEDADRRRTARHRELRPGSASAGSGAAISPVLNASAALAVN